MTRQIDSYRALSLMKENFLFQAQMLEASRRMHTVSLPFLVSLMDSVFTATHTEA